MLKKRILIILIIVSTIFGLSSCSKYQKLLKSSNTELKYEKAIEYYNEGDYYRALQLFEIILPYYRGTSRAEKIAYYYSMSHYFQNDFILASFHLSNFAKTFPKSKHAKECTYLAAYCNYLESPKYSLDQTYTYKAIESFQLFADKFPKSDSVKLCNQYIDELRQKLMKKAYNISKLYFKTENYKAAITSFGVNLQTYPNTPYKVESMFYSLKASYLLAEKSIEDKKYERYKNTVEAYERLIAHYGEENQFAKEAKNIYGKSKSALEELKQNIN